MRVTLPIAQAFNKLKHAELNPIVEFLEASRGEALELMAQCGDEWQWRQAQGRAALIKELLDLVAKAPELADKLRRAPR